MRAPLSSESPAPASWPQTSAGHLQPQGLTNLYRILRAAFVVALTALLTYCVILTRHWPMMVNAPVMHYVNFLMQHGMRPYRDITDMNLPGAYMLERFGMIFGGGSDAGWRFYDLFLLAMLLLAAVVIAAPYDWLAGIWAGGLFALRHITEGPWFSGEREQEMAVLLLVACACLFVAERRRLPVLCILFGFCAGEAASIKPTLLPFAFLAVLPLMQTLRAQHRAVRPYLLWALAGISTAVACSVAFLWHFHAFGGLVFVLRQVTPQYATLHNAGLRTLLRHAMPDEWLVPIALALVALAMQRTWNWERSVLAIGAACGLLSYLAQGKGFWYQRYIFLAFLLVLAGVELFPAARRLLPGRERVPAILALLWSLLYVFPHAWHDLRRLPDQSAFTESLEQDLASLGGQTLQHRVQCFDMTFGCLNALYHLGLVENTGFTGDLLLFPGKPSAASTYYQQKFWQAQQVQPARVIVVTNQEFNQPNSFTRLERWPCFQSYLAHDYTLQIQKSFPYEDRYKGTPPAPPAVTPTYRIYKRRPQAARTNTPGEYAGGCPWGGNPSP